MNRNCRAQKHKKQLRELKLPTAQVKSTFCIGSVCRPCDTKVTAELEQPLRGEMRGEISEADRGEDVISVGVR